MFIRDLHTFCSTSRLDSDWLNQNLGIRYPGMWIFKNSPGDSSVLPDLRAIGVIQASRKSPGELVKQRVAERLPELGPGRCAGAQGVGGRWPGPPPPAACSPRCPGGQARQLAAPRSAAMDASPALLGTPPAEVLEEALREQFGPLPHLAAICRLKRLPSGGYSSIEDLQLVLERRRVANAKERERVSAGPVGSPPRDSAAFFLGPPRLTTPS